jgi:hypothetical protein
MKINLWKVYKNCSGEDVLIIDHKKSLPRYACYIGIRKSLKGDVLCYFNKNGVSSKPRFNICNLKPNSIVYVKNNDDKFYLRRYFSHFNSNGKIVCFSDGKSRWNANPHEVSTWDEWKRSF